MANQFERSNYPTQEPDELVIGDRWVWRRDDLVSDYPLASFALSYEFHEDSGGSGSHKFTIAATEADDSYLVEIASSTTASLPDGDFKWYAFITRSSDNERVSVDEGRTTIVKNFANTNADLRSHAKKVLDAVQAVIENRASVDQSSFSIAGRSLSRMSIDELLTLKNRYKAEYLREIKEARIKNKQRSGNTIGVKF